jgi:hypothetical protein
VEVEAYRKDAPSYVEDKDKAAGVVVVDHLPQQVVVVAVQVAS